MNVTKGKRLWVLGGLSAAWEAWLATLSLASSGHNVWGNHPHVRLASRTLGRAREDRRLQPSCSAAVDAMASGRGCWGTASWGPVWAEAKGQWEKGQVSLLGAGAADAGLTTGSGAPT